MKHSILPPSSAGIWGKSDGCTGWVLMSQMYPDVDGGNGEDDEGTAVHEIGESIIKRFAGADFNIKPEQYIDTIAANGVVITDEMFEAALMYAENVGEAMRKHAIFGGPNFGIEQKIDVPGVHEYCYGTPDTWWFDEKTGTLYIWDLKFGYIIVEVFENWQLLCYIAGLITHLQINGIAAQHIKVNMRVVQPRAPHRDGPIREWTATLSDLRGYINTMHGNAHKALSNESELRTGSHCRFCSARHACGPALAAGVGLYEAAARPLPDELTPEQMGLQLKIIKRAIDQLSYIESGYEEQIKNLVARGERVPGWCVETACGRLTWSKPTAEVLALGDMMGKNLRKSLQPITPAQAISKGMDESLISSYATKPKRGLKIVPDTNLHNKAKQVFSQ